MDGGKSEEDLTQFEAKSDSFWDIGNYQGVIKRIENGARMCGDFAKMAQERADIEAKYSRGLQQWSKKWEEQVSKGPEYSSMEMGWKTCLIEANQVADIHAEVCSKIQHDIIGNIHIWKSNHFQKSIRGLKEAKRAEEGFVQAQKPWLKRLQKSSRAKKSYHKSAYDLEVLQGKLRVAETSPDITSEQCAKTRDKCEQAERMFDKALEKYKQRLAELQHYQSRYIEDITILFDKCQEAEQVRMEFFRQTFLRLKQALDIHNTQSLSPVYSEYEKTLSRLSPDDDLRWYALHQGTGMNYQWPDFEPYQANSKSSSFQSSKPSPPINHKGPSSSGSTQQVQHGSQAGSSSSNSPAINSGSIKHQRSLDSSDDDGWMKPPPPVGDSTNAARGSRNDSEEPEGQLMRAIYDYSGSEEDDLCFKEGDVVRVMFEGEDGWAEAMMGEKYGYVPISYLEPCGTS